MERDWRTTNAKVILLLAAAFVALSVLVVSGSVLGTITGDQPPASGDWVIDQPTRVTGESITVHGNLTINDELTIDTSTITMNLTSENSTKVNVTTSGKLVMVDSTITSIDTDLEYGFHVHGEMDVRRSDIKECYGGLRVMTKKTVLVQDSNILECTGSGLYLKDADGTTVKNVNVQSDDFSMSKYNSYTASIDYGYTYVYSYNSIIHVDGGNPTIDDLDVSVNGSISIESWIEKSVYYNYFYFYVYFGGVLIDSLDFDSLGSIYYHDSEVGLRVMNTVNNTYTSSCYMYVYSYVYSQACVFTKFSELTLSGFNIDNIADTYPYVANSYKNYPVTFYGSSYFYKQLFSLTTRGDYSDAGPHNLSLTLKDASFKESSVLSYYFEPTYSGSMTPTFNIDIIIDNITVDGRTSSELFYAYINPQITGLKIVNMDLSITNSTFTNLSNQLLYHYIRYGTGVNSDHTFEITEHINIENNTFRDCQLSTYLIYHYGYNYYELNNRRDITFAIRNNTFENIYSSSYMFYLYGGYSPSRGLERLIIEDNELIDVTTGSSYGMYLMGWERLLIRNNLFENFECYYYGFYMIDYGGYVNGVKPVRWYIINNTFINCYTTYGYEYYGFFRMYGAYDVEIARNRITRCSSTFMSFDAYTYYGPSVKIDFHDNELWNNTGPVVYLYEYSAELMDMTLDIHDNMAWNSSGQFVAFYAHSYQTTYDYDGKISFTDNEVTNFTGTMFSCYGDMTITDNHISDCAGFVFELQYLNLHIPTISRNIISDCGNVYSISAKTKGVEKISISMDDLKVKCTGIAFKFVNVDMTLTNVEIHEDVGLGIIADSSNVDLVDSLMPVGSGQIVGDGSINVWFNIEANVFWGNCMGIDSCAPVPEAIVIFTGSQGLYYTSTYTDENGHMRPRRVLNWNMDGPFVTLWSPYTVTVAKSGMSNSTILELDKSYVGENAETILLWDNSDPYVQLFSPIPNSLINVENLTVMGFTTELGSGIDVLEIAINDEEPIPMEVNEEGDFEITIFNIPQGDVTIRATVKDVATNSDFTILSVRIDRTPPSMRILDPPPGYTTNEDTVQVRAEIEDGALVYINAVEWGISPGSVSLDFPLSEGLNIISIEATDEAGNVAIDVRTVYLDTIVPSLSLFAPRDMSLTRMTNITAEGEAEVDSTVTISVFRSDTDLIEEVVTTDIEGMFSHGVDLSEGVNRIEVKVADSAGNAFFLTRKVTLDTTPPECGIDEPVDGYTTNSETVNVKGWADTGDVLVYLNGKQIFSTGSFELTVRLHEGENVITLSAVDTIGNENHQSIKVIMDTTAPMLQISTPVETSILTNMPTVRFVGLIDGEFEGLTANGEAVVVDDGTFDVLVPVAQNTRADIVLVVYDEAGNLRRYSVSVDHSTALPPISVEFSPGGSVVRSLDGNLYITGMTTELVKDVGVLHESDSGSDAHTYSVRESLFSIVLSLEKGDNSVVLEVTDIYGNTNSTAPYLVVYDPPSVKDDTGDEVTISPQNLGLALLVIAITLFITAVIVTRSMKVKRQE